MCGLFVHDKPGEYQVAMNKFYLVGASETLHGCMHAHTRARQSADQAIRQCASERCSSRIREALLN